MHRYLITGGSGFIGSNLIKKLLDCYIEVINVDSKPPQLPEHDIYWKECDIKNKEKLLSIFSEFNPTHVIHLAAKANLSGRSVSDFPDNTLGTFNVVLGVNKTNSVKIFINTSTQYVVRPGILPDNEAQLIPYSAYGESKAEAERIVRRDCKRNWIIIRPTNIWGPLHPFFPYELWRYLRLRYYIHPGYKPIKKHYGYVENAVNQILSIAQTAGVEGSLGKVFYITDLPIDSAEWMNGFSVALSGKNMRRLPLPAWNTLAKCGDVINKIGIRFPINSDRYFRLTINEQIPEELIIRLPENELISLECGIQRSVDWYNNYFRKL